MTATTKAVLELVAAAERARQTGLTDDDNLIKDAQLAYTAAIQDVAFAHHTDGGGKLDTHSVITGLAVTLGLLLRAQSPDRVSTFVHLLQTIEVVTDAAIEPGRPQMSDTPLDTPLYPIRPELIAKYVEQNRTDLLLSLFNSIKNQRDRAETTCAIYQQRIRQLEAREQTPSGMFVKSELAPHRLTEERRGETRRAAPKSVEKAKPPAALDLALDL